MKKFTVYKDNQIIARYEGLEEEVKNICKFKEWLYLEGWPTDTQYIFNDQIVDFPDKPSDNYFWSWEDLSWVIKPDILDSIYRTKREELLLSSDWTQLPDVPEATKLKYQSYRQQLRDITLQENYPVDVVWPTIPES